MQTTLRPFALLLLLGALPIGAGANDWTGGPGACSLPPNGSIMYALMATNPGLAATLPGCSTLHPPDIAPMTEGTRTAASDLPAGCVIPATGEWLCPGQLGGYCMSREAQAGSPGNYGVGPGNAFVYQNAQTWQDILLCDKDGNPVTQGAVPAGLACDRGDVGRRIGGDNGTCSQCVQPVPDPKDNGNGVWITVSCDLPPNPDPELRVVTRQKMIDCDGGQDGSAYMFASRNDLCTGMGYGPNRFFRPCTAYPCPSSGGSLWPNGKSKCLSVGDGPYYGTCIIDARCRHTGGYTFSGPCREGGPNMDYGPWEMPPESSYGALNSVSTRPDTAATPPSAVTPPVSPPATPAPLTVPGDTVDFGAHPSDAPDSSIAGSQQRVSASGRLGGEGGPLVAASGIGSPDPWLGGAGESLRDGYFALGNSRTPVAPTAEAARPTRGVATRALGAPAIRQAPAEANSTSACAPKTPIGGEPYGPQARSVSQLKGFPARLLKEYDVLADYLREQDKDFGKGRPACLSFGAHLAYTMDLRLPQLAASCGEPDWARAGLALTWEGLAESGEALARCGLAALQGKCRDCGRP